MPSYVTQIAEPEVLDIMNYILLPLQSLGYLLVYSTGGFVDYDSLLISLLPVPVVTLACLYWVPESPHHFVSQGNSDAAKGSVNMLRRGISTNAAELVIQDIQERVSKQQSEELNWSSQLSDQSNVRALRLAVVLQSLLPLAGAPVTLMVTPLLLRHVPAAVAVLGIAIFLACVTLPVLMRGWGYQKPLVGSLLAMALSMLVLGLHTMHLDSGKDMSSLTVLPSACLLLYLVAFLTGCIRSAENVTRDLFRPQFSVLGTSAALTCSFLVSLLVAFFYFPLGQLLGDAVLAWLLATFCVLASVFVAIYVPDTSRMSPTEVQSFLNQGGVQ